MLTLTPTESRVLGVLVEKALTTPTQYPLSLNGLTSGCNQRNNREPILALEEEDALEGIDGLRSKSLASEVMMSGSRVSKYKHTAREELGIGTSELVVLTELLLRGPQTVGELRGRASRMHALESGEVVKGILDSLASREEALVLELPPGPGSRAPRYAQRLCPDLHPLDAPAPAAGAPRRPSSDLEARVERLEDEVANLRSRLDELAGG